MVNWLRWGKDKKPPEPARESAPHTASSIPEARPAPAQPAPAMPDRPDYSSAPPALSLHAPRFDGAFAPLVIVGLGAFGQAVVETLAAWLPPPAPDGARAVTLRAIRVSGEPSVMHWDLPASRSKLLPTERLELGQRRQGDREWTRRDGYDALLQDVRTEPSQVWNMFQGILARQPKADFWVVASAFDPVGSGMIFDAAHLIHLVAKAQEHTPFVGWMLALPGDDWGDDEKPIAAATLREVSRLLRPGATRTVSYSPGSQNYLLHKHDAVDRDDAQVVCLCEPPRDADPRTAAAQLCYRMALTLLTLMQKDVWPQFQGNGPKPTTLTKGDTFVSALGAYAYHAPLPELQQLVRSQLARDILISREWGVVRPVRSISIDPDEDGASTVLKSIQHDLFRAIAEAVFQRRRPQRWPDTIEAELTLASVLRVHLQGLVDPGVQGGGLPACYALLEGLDDFLTRSGLPDYRLASLQTIISLARSELDDWQKWLTAVREVPDNALRQAQEQWKAAQEEPGCKCTLSGEEPQTVLRGFSAPEHSVKKRLADYVRWAWIRQDTRLTLRLDVLYPGCDRERTDWRHAPDKQRFPSLWQQTLQIVTALTQETQDWPSFGLMKEDSTAESHTATGPEPLLMLDYQVDDRSGPPLQKFMVQASQNDDWRAKVWFPPGIQPAQVKLQEWPDWGFLLEVHHLIPLTSVKRLADLRRRYAAARSQAATLHLFEFEQEAAHSEEAMLKDRSLPRQQRGTLDVTWLSPGTMELLQKPEPARSFVLAWLAGLVIPDLARSQYRVLRRLRMSAASEICRLEASHPLEALARWLERPATDQESLAAVVKAQLPIQDDQSQRWDDLHRLDARDQRNAEWILLVHSLSQVSGS